MKARAWSVLRFVLSAWGVTVAGCTHAAAPKRGVALAPRAQLGVTARLGAHAGIEVHLDAPLSDEMSVHLALGARPIRTALWDVALGLPVRKDAYRIELRQSFISRTSGAWQLRLGAWPHGGTGALATRRRRASFFRPQQILPQPFGIVLARRAHPEQARSQAMRLAYGTLIAAAPKRAWAWRGDAWQVATPCRTSRDCPAQRICSAAHRCMARHGQTPDGAHVAALRLDDGLHIDVLSFDAEQPVAKALLQVRLDAEYGRMRAVRAGRSVLTRGRQMQHKHVRGQWVLGLLWGDAVQLDDALRGRRLTYGGALRLRRAMRDKAPVLRLDYAQQLHRRLFVSAWLSSAAPRTAGPKPSGQARVRIALKLTQSSVLWALSDATLGDTYFDLARPATFALGIARSPQRSAGGLGGRMQLRGVRHAPTSQGLAKASLHAEGLVSGIGRGGALGPTRLHVQLRGQSVVAGAPLRLCLMPAIVLRHPHGLWQLQAAARWQLFGPAAADAPVHWVRAAGLVRKRRWAGRIETRFLTERGRFVRLEHVTLSVSLTL